MGETFEPTKSTVGDIEVKHNQAIAPSLCWNTTHRRECSVPLFRHVLGPANWTTSWRQSMSDQRGPTG